MSENHQQDSLARDVIGALQPQLSALESQHQALREKTRQQLIALGVVTLVAMILSRWLLGAGVSAAALLVGAGSAGWLLWLRQQDWRETVVKAVVPQLCETLGGLEYLPKVRGTEYLSPFERLGVIGESNDRKLEHLFQGTHDQTRFQLVGANLRRSSRGRDSTSSTSREVFQGLLFRIQLPYTMDRRLLIMPNTGLDFFNKRPGMTRVALDDEAFDQRFVVQHDSDDAHGEARAKSLLTPAFRQALLHLSETEGRRAFAHGALVAGMTRDSLYLALERYQPASGKGKIQVQKPRPFLGVAFFMSENGQLDKAVGDMVVDITTAHRVIDQLGLRSR